MYFFVAAALFLLGASLGSFINVIALRLLSGESFLRGRSHCPACGSVLSWRELIPVVSFFVLRGRCRSCRAPISFRYLLVELAMGSYAAFLGASLFSSRLALPFPNFAAAFTGGEVFFYLLLYLAIGSLALILLLVDFDTKLILTALTRGMALAGIILIMAEFFSTPTELLLSPPLLQALLAAGIGLFFAGVWFFTSGRGMGLGDAELALALSLFLLYPRAILMLLAAFWAGALWGIGLMVFAGYDKKSQIPFGPFIILGFVVALFWGSALLPYLLPLI